MNENHFIFHEALIFENIELLISFWAVFHPTYSKMSAIRNNSSRIKIKENKLFSLKAHSYNGAIILTNEDLFRRVAAALCGGRGDDPLPLAGARRGEGAAERGGAGPAQRREHAPRLPGGAKAQVPPGAPRHRLAPPHRQFHVSIAIDLATLHPILRPLSRQIDRSSVCCGREGWMMHLDDGIP